jgi:hypothetical protein
MTGYIEHTSVMHACRRVDYWRAQDSYFRAVTDQLLRIAEHSRQVAHQEGRRRLMQLADQMADRADLEALS